MATTAISTICNKKIDAVDSSSIYHLINLFMVLILIY